MSTEDGYDWQYDDKMCTEMSCRVGDYLLQVYYAGPSFTWIVSRIQKDSTRYVNTKGFREHGHLATQAAEKEHKALVGLDQLPRMGFCDHEFIGPPYCAHCGWKPPTPYKEPKDVTHLPE